MTFISTRPAAALFAAVMAFALWLPTLDVPPATGFAQPELAGELI